MFIQQLVLKMLTEDTTTIVQLNRADKRAIANNKNKLISKMKKFLLTWKHTPVDPNIIRPVNEFARKAGEFKESKLDELSQKVKQHPGFSDALAKFTRNNIQFSTNHRRKFAMVPWYQILIDEDVQRELDVEWALNILRDFDPSKVTVIYATKDVGKDIYRAGDGQHGAVVQFILYSAKILIDHPDASGLLDGLMLPVYYIETNDRSFMRDVVIDMNGRRKLPIDEKTILKSFVYKYRLDDKRDPKSVLYHEQVLALEKFNLTVVGVKDKANNALAGAISNAKAVMSRTPSILAFLGLMHSRYWDDSTVPSIEFGFYDSFYREYITGDYQIDPQDPAFLLFMDQIHAVIKRVFGSMQNVESNVENAYRLWYKAKYGVQVKVPSSSYTLKAAAICRIYEKLGGAYPIMKNAVITITDVHDLTDFFTPEVTARINNIIEHG